MGDYLSPFLRPGCALSKCQLSEARPEPAKHLRLFSPCLWSLLAQQALRALLIHPSYSHLLICSPDYTLLVQLPSLFLCPSTDGCLQACFRVSHLAKHKSSISALLIKIPLSLSIDFRVHCKVLKLTHATCALEPPHLLPNSQQMKPHVVLRGPDALRSLCLCVCHPVWQSLPHSLSLFD